MIDLLVIISRFVEYLGAMVLFGSSLLLLYGKPIPAVASAPDILWTKHLLSGGAIALFLGTVTGFLAQTSGLAGSVGAAIEPATLKAALLEMNYGPSSLIRLAAALLAILAAQWVQPGPRLWFLCSLCGAIACASFVWMGHGAATEGTLGWLHLIGDIAHSLAAAGWIGALVAFCVLLAAPIRPDTHQKALCGSLMQFSAVGTALVAVIIASGLINSAFLVGWNPAHIVATRYGQVLIAKLLLFALMLALAAANRFRHTPALTQALERGGDPLAALSQLRQSVTAETVTAAGVLALVSWLGTLAPVTTQ